MVIEATPIVPSEKNRRAVRLRTLHDLIDDVTYDSPTLTSDGGCSLSREFGGPPKQGKVAKPAVGSLFFELWTRENMAIIRGGGWDRIKRAALLRLSELSLRSPSIVVFTGDLNRHRRAWLLESLQSATSRPRVCK